MSQQSDAAGETIPFKVTNAERIPSRRYYDADFYKLEREKFWPHVWQMACRLEEIPEVGDWVEYKIFDKSVLIVNTKEGIMAFHNACRHRGVKLGEGQGNCRAKGFVCPFHGWRWDVNGKNTFVFGRSIFSEENLNPEELDLVRCRVELWGNCAFINFDHNAPPLLDCIQPAADRFGIRNVDKLQVEWWSSTILPANWKLAMEAFMEGYHVMKTHPQLFSVPTTGTNRYGFDAGVKPRASNQSAREAVDGAIHHMELLSEGMAGMIHASDIAVAHDLRDMELPDDLDQAMGKFFGTLNAEITARARAKGIPMPDLNEVAMKDRASPVQFVFPNYFLLPSFGNMVAYRIRPLSEETCLFEIWSLVLYPEGEKREKPVPPTPMPCDDPRFPEVPRQDYANLPLQQVGLHADGFDYMRLSQDVEGIISNYQRTLDGFLEGRPPEQLVKAIQVSCGTLDEPIADIGF